ncbi:MAG: ethylbenzene dehydrogenase-related protein [Armatimonadota bacterium]|nr:ethylbenzene dehydrogenase-related protein [Armatimonadota bacterium]
MFPQFHRSVLSGIIAVAVALTWTAGPTVNPAGAQAPPVIKAGGLFTFHGDWSKIPAATITVFYPAQSSWQFLTSGSHPGNKEVLAGTRCQTCHQDQEKTLGERLVKGGAREPDPVAGKRGSVDVSARAAFDDQYIYLRFEWAAPRPGVGHELWRFDGSRWVPWGGPKPEATKRNIPASYEDRLALMLTERNVPAADHAQTGFNQAGCFIACHNSMRNMPNAVTGDRVRNHPYLGTGGLGVSDIRHYLLLTRAATDETGGWDKVKTATEIERLKAEGSFLDLWQWRAFRSGPLGYATDDYVLDYRLTDAGRYPYTTPARPSFMYDQTKTGFRAIPEARYTELLPQLPLIMGVNAVPLDPSASFAVGDLLPRPILRTPEGSAADIMANASWQNGRWVVELRRKLVTGNADDKPLKPGRVYRFGIALFDDNVESRYHLISFVHTLGLGEKTTATVRAVRVGR